MNSHGERQDGKTMDAIEIFHRDRYTWAANRIAGNSILDCACGGGYGTKIISNMFPDKKITGVDISREAIDHAIKYFNADNITYVVQDMMKLQLEDKFDTIVSLETVEHVSSPKDILGILSSYLNPNGRIIISFPSQPTLGHNTFHKFERKNMKECIQYVKSIGYNIAESFEQNGRGRRTYGLFMINPVSGDNHG